MKKVITSNKKSIFLKFAKKKKITIRNQNKIKKLEQIGFLKKL